MAFMGDGPDLDSIQAQATRLDLSSRVRFSGRCEDIPARLASASAFVQATDSEGLPVCLPAPMRGGLLVVASELGEAVELVEVVEAVQDGVYGRIVRPNDGTAPDAALRELLSSCQLRERMVTPRAPAARPNSALTCNPKPLALRTDARRFSFTTYHEPR